MLIDHLDDYAQAADSVGRIDVHAVGGAESLDAMIRGVVPGASSDAPSSTLGGRVKAVELGFPDPGDLSPALVQMGIALHLKACASSAWPSRSPPS